MANKTCGDCLYHDKKQHKHCLYHDGLRINANSTPCSHFEEAEKLAQKTAEDVDHPNHYIHGGIETIDVIKAWMTKEQYIGFLLGNVIKYVSRWQDKGLKVDLEKARWYLDRAIKEEE